MVQTPVKPKTLEEFLTLPETKPASEYIDGKIIQKPMPKGRHSILQAELGAAINSILRNKGVATAFTELRCTFGDRSVVPDIAVFENSRIPRSENGEIGDIFTAAPDWTIEILSPDQHMTKVLKNITHCIAHGSQMGWAIDPDDRSIIVCQSGQDLRVIDEAATLLPVPVFASTLQLTLNDVFEWLK
ncbi:Uma2 family endonuclease [Altericista sp. CCNU0014]|uniref:Uma2 family endonuclease n=1 Tax=Altericista sp. CCNU0014 TaxID=3082949 RepID=UPI00384A92FA